MSSKANQEALLAAIQRKAPQAPAASVPAAPVVDVIKAEQPEAKRKAPGKAAGNPKNRVGKQVQFWLQDEDRRLIREFAAWLAGQGERVSDSLVVRATLRMAKSNPEFLKAYRQVSQMDGRLKQHKTA